MIWRQVTYFTNMGLKYIWNIDLWTFAMTPLGAKMAGEKEDDRDQNRAVWPCVYILHGALSPLCGADSAEELVCLYVRGRRLAEGTPAVTSHSRGLEAKDGAPGKSLHHRVCFLVLFWPWSAHRKERKKIETSCRSLEGSSGTGESVWESASIVVFRGWISYLSLPVAEVERREIMGRFTKVSLEKHRLLIASVYRAFCEDRAF